MKVYRNLIKEHWLKTFLFGYKCSCCNFRDHLPPVANGNVFCRYCGKTLFELH